MPESLISPSDPKAVRAAALSLSAEERAALASELWESLDVEEQTEFDEEFLREIQRRVDDIKSGKAVLIDGELVRQEARRRVGL
jgi:putative addiction module component (TIGR02574 family)